MFYFTSMREMCADTHTVFCSYTTTVISVLAASAELDRDSRILVYAVMCANFYTILYATAILMLASSMKLDENSSRALDYARSSYAEEK